MTTEQKLANTHDMKLPRVIELMDMSETTHQKVCVLAFLCNVFNKTFLEYGFVV